MNVPRQHSGHRQREQSANATERLHPAPVRASRGDREPIVEALTQAFEHDPVLNWVVRSDGQRIDAKRSFFRANFDYYEPHCLVFVAKTAGGVAGASLWAPPGKWQLGLAREITLLPTIVRMMSAQRVPRALRAMTRMEAAHPKVPHYYLNVLGVVPEQRSKGHAAALIEAGLAEATAAKLPAYLENSNPANLPIYRRHGFDLIDTLYLGVDAPPLYLMWRE